MNWLSSIAVKYIEEDGAVRICGSNTEDISSLVKVILSNKPDCRVVNCNPALCSTMPDITAKENIIVSGCSTECQSTAHYCNASSYRLCMFPSSAWFSHEDALVLTECQVSWDESTASVVKESNGLFQVLHSEPTKESHSLVSASC